MVSRNKKFEWKPKRERTGIKFADEGKMGVVPRSSRGGENKKKICRRVIIEWHCSPNEETSKIITIIIVGTLGV